MACLLFCLGLSSGNILLVLTYAFVFLIIASDPILIHEVCSLLYERHVRVQRSMYLAIKCVVSFLFGRISRSVGDVSGELQDGRAHVWGSARFCQNVQGFLGNRAFSVVFLLLFRICIRQLCIPDFLGPVEYCCNIENEEARSDWKQMTRLVTPWTTAEIIVNIPTMHSCASALFPQHLVNVLGTTMELCSKRHVLAATLENRQPMS